MLAAAFFGTYLYRHRFVRSDGDLIKLLPSDSTATFYIDVAALRRSGTLRIFTGSHASEEHDYREFVNNTHLDYSTDIDSIAGAIGPSELLLLARGRFDWNRLRAYTYAHGGSCREDFCRVRSNQTQRWLSFSAPQPDVLALALSNEPQSFHFQTAGSTAQPIPTQPIWAHISPQLLKNPSSLPPALRLVATAVQPADSITLSLDASHSGASDFELQLDAACRNAETAETLRKQLSIDTKMIALEFAREHVQPNAADLSGLLTSGTFEVFGSRVVGRWSVPRALLNSLQ